MSYKRFFTIIYLIPAIALTWFAFPVKVQAQGRTTIYSVQPYEVHNGDLVELVGSNFGDAPGTNDKRYVLVLEQSGYHCSGNFCGGPSPKPVPIVSWTNEHIVVYITGLEAGEYQIFLGIEDGSNKMPLLVEEDRDPPPPARPANNFSGQTIRSILPELASSGSLIDVYGRFPNIRMGGTKFVLKPVDHDYDTTPPEVLSPIRGEFDNHHVRLRLPDSLPPGKYLLIPRGENGTVGVGKILIIRSTVKAYWEQ